MRGRGAAGVLCLMALGALTPVLGWSLGDAVTVIDPNLSAEVVWENPDSKTYCTSSPQNLDRLACDLPQDEEFWIGVDAAGNRYGTIIAIEPMGDFYDIYRRPAGTNFNHHIARIIKRTEPIPTEVTKIFIASEWEVDAINGAILIGLQGSCMDATCIAAGDTTDHLALLRITGLPIILDVVASYAPPSTFSFTIPVFPEGLPSGDAFDVFVGDIATLPDFSQSQQLACNVAAGEPVGARVDTFDPLADPSLGEARYYVTAATSGLDRRAGRQRTDGVLSGRDVSGMPACGTP